MTTVDQRAIKSWAQGKIYEELHAPMWAVSVFGVPLSNVNCPFCAGILGIGCENWSHKEKPPQ